MIINHGNTLDAFLITKVALRIFSLLILKLKILHNLILNGLMLIMINIMKIGTIGEIKIEE